MSNETPQSPGEKPNAAEEPLYGEAVQENPDAAAELGEPVQEHEPEPERYRTPAEAPAEVSGAEPVSATGPVSAEESEDAPVVTEHPVTEHPVTEHPVTEAYDHTGTGEQTWAPTPARQYQPASPVYVTAPTPPTKRSNRGPGVLIAILAAIVFGVVYLLAVAVIGVLGDRAGFVDAISNFIVSPGFYVPVVFFAIALIILVQIVNRSSWWVYIIGSFFVGAVVYFAFFGGALLSEKAWNMTPHHVADLVRTMWVNPYALIAGILANEVSIWMSGWLSVRGRRLKAKNADAKDEYDRQVAAGPQPASY